MKNILWKNHVKIGIIEQGIANQPFWQRRGWPSSYPGMYTWYVYTLEFSMFSLTSCSPRMLLVLVREFESRRGEILNIFAKKEKEKG